MAARPSASQKSTPVSHVLRDGWALAALEREGIITRADADRLRAEKPEWVVTPLIARGVVSIEKAGPILARAAHVPLADLEHVDPAAAQFLPEIAARGFLVLPLAATDKVLRVATANPLDLDA